MGGTALNTGGTVVGGAVTGEAVVGGLVAGGAVVAVPVLPVLFDEPMVLVDPVVSDDAAGLGASFEPHVSVAITAINATIPTAKVHHFQWKGPPDWDLLGRDVGGTGPGCGTSGWDANRADAFVVSATAFATGPALAHEGVVTARVPT